MELVRSYNSIRFGLPTKPGRVGSCITIFGACLAFTHVTAYTLAKSPSDPLQQRLQQSRCLHCCSDCYRVERTSSRAGLTPAVDQRLFTARRIIPFIRWDEKAGLQRDAMRSQSSTCSRHKEKETGYEKD